MVESMELNSLQLPLKESTVTKDQLAQLRQDYTTLQCTIDTIRECSNRGLRYLEERLHHERELRNLAELSVALLQDKARFIDDNARGVIQSLQRKVIVLESMMTTRENSCTVFQFSGKPAASVPSSASSGDTSPSSQSSIVSDSLVNASAIQGRCHRNTDFTENEETQKLKKLLSIREQQLERIAAQLNDVNHDFLHQQKGLVEVTDALERARSRCIELQVELSREKRLNKDLETRLWQSDRAAAFKHQLTASAVPVVVPFPDRFPQPGATTSSGPSQQRNAVPTSSSTTILPNFSDHVLPSKVLKSYEQPALWRRGLSKTLYVRLLGGLMWIYNSIDTDSIYG